MEGNAGSRLSGHTANAEEWTRESPNGSAPARSSPPELHDLERGGIMSTSSSGSRPNLCTCPPDEFSATCPWARALTPDSEPLGHVRECPMTGEPCPCLPGSTAHAYCAFDAAESPKEPS